MTRPVIATLLAGAALVAAGCGDGHRPAAQAPVHRGPSPFATAQVRTFFEDVTGDALKLDPGASFDSLTTTDDSTRTDGRYGTFLIYVVHRPASLAALYKRGDGAPVRPDADGIYWHDDGGSWTAMKPYRNVVLEWIAQQHTTDARFKRLDAILSKLGEPAAQARAALPASDQPCAGRGIAADHGPEGTCRTTDGATVTVVNRGHRLRLPQLSVRVLKVKTGSLLVPLNPFGEFKRAKGRFVYVRVGLRNTGSQPLHGLDEVQLQVNGRNYDPDFGAGFEVTRMDAFPLQPGDYTPAGVVFDIPRTAARQAARHGVLVFPADKDLSTVQDASKLGEIRLGRAAAAAPQGTATQA